MRKKMREREKKKKKPIKYAGVILDKHTIKFWGYNDP